MDPKDFLELAKSIYQDRSNLVEARQRTAISRAYYSAFHILKPISVKIDPSIALVTSGEIHEKVITALKKSKEGKHRVLGDKLFTLRGNRNTADYHLGEIVDRKLTQDSIDLVENLIQKAS